MLAWYFFILNRIISKNTILTVFLTSIIANSGLFFVYCIIIFIIVVLFLSVCGIVRLTKTELFIVCFRYSQNISYLANLFRYVFCRPTRNKNKKTCVFLVCSILLLVSSHKTLPNNSPINLTIRILFLLHMFTINWTQKLSLNKHVWLLWSIILPSNNKVVESHYILFVFIIVLRRKSDGFWL